ncbi:Segregation and condensation protein B [Actinokineospora spheciospongiae]|uniref:Segregation and condensation protein B n=2 Tax=Actinokineospora TaxID=39845 RepID=W7IRE0_9PSEU|nr:Segregation and condensation protein B [Actinokineospora spheciospongiae]
MPPVLRSEAAGADAEASAPADPAPARAGRRKAKKSGVPPVLWPDEAGADAAGAPAGPGPAGVGRSGGGVPPVLWPDEPDEVEPAPVGGVLDESAADLVDGVTEEAVATLAADLPPEEAVDGESATSGQRFPDLRADADLDSALEAVLLVVDAPVETEVLAAAVDQPVGRTRQALRRVQARYTEAGSGIDLRRVGAGWRLFTRDRFAPVVEKLLLDGQRAKLTRAALETLAVIAYRQPVSRARVAAVRGVNVDGVIRTLVVRGLIEESGTDSETGGILYVTTELFLERLGLSSLEDLPPIAPLLPEVEAIDDVS